MKAICEACPKFQLFPPGHRLTSAAYDAGEGKAAPERYFKPDWYVLVVIALNSHSDGKLKLTFSSWFFPGLRLTAQVTALCRVFSLTLHSCATS